MPHTFRPASAVLLTALAALVGCGKSDSGTPSANPVAETNATADSPSEASLAEDSPSANSLESPAAVVALETANVAAYDAAIAENRGQVVLVDFWATWCGPCMERFPETVAWSEKYAADGLRVVSVSFDELENKDGALKFLEDHNAGFRNFISEWGIDSKSFDNFQIKGDAVPFYRLYDRAGKLRYEFNGNPEAVTGVEHLDQIETRLKELLAEPAA